MPSVVKVKTKKDYALFDRVYFEGTEFYVTNPYRHGSTTEDFSDVFDTDGEKLGEINGHYFDFAGQDLFEISDE